MIEARALRKSFGDVEAVRDVTFAAADGRVTGLLGPNGAGKTTTLRMIATIVRPDDGTCTVDGRDSVHEGLLVQANTGVLPESHGLYARLTARENVRYFGQLHGMSGPELDAAVDMLADVLDMHDIIDRRTEGFSHGETTKVALARALVHRPQNVLLDEPTAGLDVMSTRGVRQFVRTLRAEGRCVLLSTHIMQEVTALCDDVVIVARGRVVATGTPDELRERTGCDSLEDAFVSVIGSDEGLV